MNTGRIPVVDDDRDRCDLLSDFLSAAGYDVTRAYAGQEAIDAAASSAPEINAASFLEKPFSLAAVRSAVRAALEPRNGTPGAA